MTEPLPIATVGDQTISLADAPDSFIRALSAEMGRPRSPNVISPDGATRMLAPVADLNARLAAQISAETRKTGRGTVEDADVDRAVEAITGGLVAKAQNYITFAVAFAGLALTLLVAVVSVPAFQSWLWWGALLALSGGSVVMIVLSKRVKPR